MCTYMHLRTYIEHIIYLYNLTNLVNRSDLLSLSSTTGLQRHKQKNFLQILQEQVLSILAEDSIFGLHRHRQGQHFLQKLH